MTNFKKYKLLAILIVITSWFFIFSATVSTAANLKDAFTDKTTEDTMAKARLGAGYVIGPTPDSIIGTVIQTALSLLGVIFVILMIYGGYLWMTAKGNEEQVVKAKNVIIAAITGLVIVIAAYAISYFVISKISTGVLKTS